jgi:hypothetical protein
MAKPNTKLEHRVYDLHETLPVLTSKQIAYGEDNAFWKYFTVSRNRLYCLECGHKWKGDINKKRHNCPSCNKHLRPIANDSWIIAQGYMLIVTKVKEFQVFRYIYYDKLMRKECKPKFVPKETSQVWLSPDGKEVIMGIKRNGMGSYGRPQWCHGEQELSIKRNAGAIYRSHYSPYPSCTYPGGRIIPELKRTGYKTKLYKLHPIETAICLLNSNITESLLKMGDVELFKDSIKYSSRITKYWNQIKICKRHNYVIKDYNLWFDYLGMLSEFNKDLNSPKYICPENMKAEHDKYMKKKRAIQREERRAAQAEKIAKIKSELGEWKVKYVEVRKAFMDFFIKHDNITIEPIKSVDQMEEESSFLDHCAFINGYYSKNDSLLLSARINGIVTETIEINLRRMEIVQCRGFDNKASAYNKDIVKVMENNLPKIEKLYEKQLKLNQAA